MTEVSEDTETRLMTAQRGKHEELRVAWSTYRGRTYLNLRVWRNTADGWRPLKKGCTIRKDELDGLAEAIEAAKLLA